MPTLADRIYLADEDFVGQVDTLARDLIGRRLIVRENDLTVSSLILETEAYGGTDDPASHAAFRPGGRATAMFGPPGGIYIYAAYGVYPCFNIVVGPVGTPSAILVRSVRIDGTNVVTMGPGRLTRAMKITMNDHGRHLGDGRFDVSVDREKLDVNATPRIGIRRGTDTRWRFVAIQRQGMTE